MIVSDSEMEELREMTEVSFLTKHGRQLISQEPDTNLFAMRDTYQQLKFVQIENFVQPDVLTNMVAHILPQAREYMARKEIPHQISEGLLSGGSRFGRIDWSPPAVKLSSEVQEAIQSIFEKNGLIQFAVELSQLALPFFEFLVDRKLRYDRPFLLVYDEGDFIDPHGDSSTSQRVLVQMPVSFATRGAVRVLKNGFLEPFVDEPGCLRLLGAGIWHDVPPVLRLYPDHTPLRVLVAVRFAFV